jgi:hypothetical protein
MAGQGAQYRAVLSRPMRPQHRGGLALAMCWSRSKHDSATRSIRGLVDRSVLKLDGMNQVQSTISRSSARRARHRHQATRRPGLRPAARRAATDGVGPAASVRSRRGGSKPPVDRMSCARFAYHLRMAGHLIHCPATGSVRRRSETGKVLIWVVSPLIIPLGTMCN